MINRAKLIQELGTLLVLNLELATSLEKLTEEKHLLQNQVDSYSDEMLSSALRFPEILPKGSYAKSSPA